MKNYKIQTKYFFENFSYINVVYNDPISKVNSILHKNWYSIRFFKNKGGFIIIDTWKNNRPNGCKLHINI